MPTIAIDAARPVGYSTQQHVWRAEEAATAAGAKTVQPRTVDKFAQFAHAGSCTRARAWAPTATHALLALVSMVVGNPSVPLGTLSTVVFVACAGPYYSQRPGHHPQ